VQASSTKGICGATHLGETSTSAPPLRMRRSSRETRIMRRLDYLDRFYDPTVKAKEAKLRQFNEIVSCVQQSEWANDAQLLSLIEPVTPKPHTSRAALLHATVSSPSLLRTIASSPYSQKHKRRWGQHVPAAAAVATIQPGSKTEFRYPAERPSTATNATQTAHAAERLQPKSEAVDALDAFMRGAPSATAAADAAEASSEASDALTFTPVRVPFRMKRWDDVRNQIADSPTIPPAPKRPPLACKPMAPCREDALDRFLRRTEHLRFFTRP